MRKRNRRATFVLLEGNHEERVERFLDKHPQFQGILDIPVLLKLQERRIEWRQSWTKSQTYSIGRANFTHGLSTTNYHANKMVTDYGDSIFYGHTHDMQCIPRAAKLHKDKVTVGQSLGWQPAG